MAGAGIAVRRFKNFALSVKRALIQAGISVPTRRRKKQFVVESRELGLPPGFSYDNIEALIEDIEGSEHK